MTRMKTRKNPVSMSDRQSKLMAYIKDNGLSQAEVLTVLSLMDDGDDELDYGDIVDTARDLYCDSSCDVEIDDHPLFSETDDGCWVSAWVWVSYNDEEDDDECGD